MTTILMDHDDEDAPVRHEVRRACDFCGRSGNPVEILVGAGRGRITYRCANCKERQEEAYRKAYGDDFDKLATYQAEGR